MSQRIAGYPSHRAVDVVLRDGTTVLVRPARPDDRERVEDYLIGLSDASRYLRFWGASVDVTQIARQATDTDFVDHLTLLAMVNGDDGRVVGGAQYIREADASRAEVSVSVADELQGHGLGSILIAHLAQAAGDAGVSMLHAMVLPENHRMIDVFRRSGFPIHMRAVPGAVDVEFPTEITDSMDYVRAVAERLAAFTNSARSAIDETDKLGDADTADLFTEISRCADKYLYFLEAHLKG